MKDRVPTEVLENGAVRMEQFDASGNSLGYVYLKRADAPSEAGTPLCKNTLLTDETADALGLDDPTPNEAFAKLASKGEIVTFFNDSMTTATQTIDLGSNLADFTKLSFFSNENNVSVYLYDSVADAYVSMAATADGYSGLHTVDIAANGLASPANTSKFFQAIETKRITKIQIRKGGTQTKFVTLMGIRR